MRTAVAMAVLVLAGCASSQMRPYMGKDITEVVLAHGRPENVVDLPDGRRAFQFRWGGGQITTPGQSRTSVQVYGNTAIAQTTATPATTQYVEGCLLTFIGERRGESWVVTELREPKGLVC